MDGAPPPLSSRAVKRGDEGSCRFLASAGEKSRAVTISRTPITAQRRSRHAANHHQESLFGGQRISLELRVRLLLLFVVRAVSGEHRRLEARLAERLGHRLHVLGG